MDADRLVRARKKRDKAIKKMLSSNKLTNASKELALDDLYSLPVVVETSEKKRWIEKKKKLPKKFFRKLSILKKKLMGVQLKSKNLEVYNKNFKEDALQFVPASRT